MKNIYYLYLKPSFMILLSLTFVCGLIYPLVITLISQQLFPTQARGSLLIEKEIVYGSTLIGQDFHQANYFWGRPSKTEAFAYNGGSSGGSAYALSSSIWREQLTLKAAWLKQSHVTDDIIPMDLVTHSASGLDPHISQKSAYYQAHRVALARQKPIEIIEQLIEQQTQKPLLGILGEPHINVLLLNRALDKL